VQAETAASDTRRPIMQTVAGLLVILMAGVPLSKLLAAGNAASYAAETTASVVEHSIWTSPGELVSFRVTPELLSTAADADRYEWTITLKGQPEAAQLLTNPDGSQSLLWVPVAADIGSWQLEFGVLGFDRKADSRVSTTGHTAQRENTVQRTKIRMRIEVLEG